MDAEPPSGLAQTDCKPSWANIDALIDVACNALHRPRCDSITLLGNGAHNYVYRLQFSDGSDVAAQLCDVEEEYFDHSTKLSELATMRFVRESGLYPDAPVPELYATDLTFTNPIGTPYVFMEMMKGQDLHKVPKPDPALKSFDYLDPNDQILIVNRLAGLQAALSKPVPFDRIGSIIISDEGEFEIGPLTTINKYQPTLGGPYNSIDDLWHSYLEKQAMHALRNWDRIENERIPDTFYNVSPQRFGTVLQLFSLLIPYFVPPPAYNRLVLHHSDLALRNVLFDPDDLTKITGVIDWTGAQVMPLMFTARFPYDLMSDGRNPTKRANYPDEYWGTVPHDWTCFGGSPDEWAAEYNERNEKSDLASRGAAMIRRFYLRQFFGACFSKHMYEKHGDADLSHASVFADAPYYLKFHEALTGGLDLWFLHEKWLQETFSRMKMAAPVVCSLITGPNVYSTSVKSPVCDLTISEERKEERVNRIEDLRT